MVMNSRPDETYTTIVDANQRVHSILATSYNETEPHFRPENRAKVTQRLADLAKQAPSTDRLLDLGCGTGFVLSLASPLFNRLDGIDATQAMLDRVDQSLANVTTQRGVVEKLPFETATFDMVTAYSFLDHLEDPLLVLKEAHRVLKPGGILYVDLIPNRSFWASIEAAATDQNRPHNAIVEREIEELLNHEEKLEKAFGVAPEDWRNAEPAKSEGKGFEAQALKDDVSALGYEVTIRPEWFLGQAVLHHGTSSDAAGLVDSHLRSILPTTMGLFKYLVLTATKIV